MWNLLYLTLLVRLLPPPSLHFDEIARNLIFDVPTPPPAHKFVVKNGRLKSPEIIGYVWSLSLHDSLL